MTTPIPEEPMSIAEAPRPTTDQIGQPVAVHLDPSASPRSSRPAAGETKIEVRDLAVFYGARRAVRDIALDVPARAVTAFIGPSGCGKSTILRCFDRMNDLIPSARVEGSVRIDGENIYDPDVQPVDVRRRVGLVFQRPNPFPMTIYDNVAYGPRRHGIGGRARLDEIVEGSLRRAALWDEVKDDYRRTSGLALSGGQQQRLCIARTLAIDPEIVLMDEPCSALDPIATLKIEELIGELRHQFTIVIVTHNMQQASRVSDTTAFFTMGDDRAGYLVEMGPTVDIFTNPKQQLTEDYVSGRFG
jgi:phosphate transport system ATP-binding protein